MGGRSERCHPGNADRLELPVQGQSDPDLQKGIGRDKTLATGGLSSALGSDLGNLFTFLNLQFPHL